MLTDVEQVAAIDASADPIRALLDGAGIQLREAAAELRRYRESIEVDPARLASLDERLGAIHDLARKHRTDPAELPALLERLREEMEAIEQAGTRLAELEAIEQKLLSEYEDAAGALHTSRKKAARALAAAVTKNIRALGMPGGEFRVAVEATRDGPPSASGWDSVAFEVAINPGQAPMPLARVASGGELSRISLAIQVIATRGSGVPTLIFDEVDAGVGGRVAEMVGRELRRLAGHRQVLCVTHLPQVASLAQQHVRVQKRSRRRETHTDLSSLSGEGRVEEIARMLGGVTITDQALAHAREMLERG